MKKLIIILLMSMTFFTIQSQAVEQNIPTQIQDSFDAKISAYYPKIQESAKGLLYSLAVISMVITFGFMAMRGELELGGAAAQLVKYALLTGFFSMLIESPTWFYNIYKGFDSLGSSAGGVKFDNVINNIFDMWNSILKKMSIWEPAEAIGFFMAGIVATFALTVLIGNALMAYGFTVMSIYIGVFWLGFGVFEQTRPWAINSIVNVVRWSVKWMMMLILISITLSLVDDTLNKGFDDFNSIITLFVVSMMMVTITNGMSAFVDGYFNGSGGGENNRGMQLAQTAMSAAAGAGLGAYAGMKGASDTIKAASASGESMSVGQRAGAMLGGMAGGAAKGAIHGGESFASNWAKTVDSNYSMSSNTPTPQNPSAGFGKSPSSDGDVGGGTKGSIAEPKVGGEINPNQSDKS